MEEGNRTFKIMKSLVIVIVSIVIASLACFLILREKISESIMNEIYETTNEESISYKESVIREAEEMNLLLDTFEKILLKNSDWTNLKLSKKFVKNYNQDNGILGDKNVDWVELDWRTKNNEKQIVAFIHDDKQVDYYYFAYLLNEKGELDDVIIKEIYNYKDENGDEIIHYKKMDEKNYLSNIYILSFSQDYYFWITNNELDDWKRIDMTDNFKKNYNMKQGLLPIQYVLLIEIDWDNSSFENKYVIIKAKYVDKDVKYKISYTTDKDLKLDSVEVNTITENNIDDTEMNRRKALFFEDYGFEWN